MKRNLIQISSFLMAGIFLLMIVFQSIHRIEHAQHHGKDTFSEITKKDLDSNLHLKKLSVHHECSLCDFVIGQVGEIPVYNYEGLTLNDFKFKTEVSYTDSFRSTSFLTSFYLRGPPASLFV